MPRYKLFYLRDSHVEKFRESPPSPKPYGLRDRDYEHVGEIEAPGPYAVWKQLHGEPEEQYGGRPLGVGDALESEEPSLLVLNHWGFDEAEWRSTESNEDETAPAVSVGAEAG